MSQIRVADHSASGTVCKVEFVTGAAIDEGLPAHSILISCAPGGTATLVLANVILIPQQLLLEIAPDTYRFRTISELKEALAHKGADALEHLLAKRRELAEEFLTIQLRIDAAAGASFFDANAVASVGEAASLVVTCSLRPGVLLEEVAPDNAPILMIKARAEIAVATRLQLSDAPSNLDAVNREWLATFTLRKDELPAIDLRLEVSLFDFNWPKISFPNLSLGNLSLPPIDGLLRIPSWNNGPVFSWDGGQAPTFALLVDAGRVILTSAAPASGSIQFNGTTLFRVENFQLIELNGATGIIGTIAATSSTQFSVDKSVGPFRIRTRDAQVKYGAQMVAGQGLQSSVRIEFSALELSAVSDPALVLTLKMTFTMRVSQHGDVSTELDELDVTKPYPIKLLARAANALADVIRLIGSIPLANPGMPDAPELKFLDTLARMLTAAVRWFAEQAGNALLGLAEAVKAALEALLRALKDAFDGVALKNVCVEVCLEPRTFKLLQITISPGMAAASADAKYIAVGGLGMDARIPRLHRPMLLLRFGDRPAAALVSWLASDDPLVIGTDLWLSSANGAQQALADMPTSTAPQTRPAGPDKTRKIFSVTATRAANPGVNKALGVVLASIHKGDRRARFLQKIERSEQKPAAEIHSHGNVLLFQVEAAAEFVPFSSTDFTIKAEVQTERILNLFGKSAEKPDDSNDNSLLKQLSQYVEVTKLDTSPGSLVPVKGFVSVPFRIKLKVAGNSIEANLSLDVQLRTFAMRLSGADSIKLRGPARDQEMLAFRLTIKPKSPDVVGGDKQFDQFVLSFAEGDARLKLADAALAEISYNKVSRQGRGLVFAIDEFGITRDGLDLAAHITPEPVVLAGVDTPFRFTSGALTVKRGRILSASIGGSGLLPPKLVGEATAEVAIGLGRGESGDLVVESAMGSLKPGAPLVCEGTRFRFQLDELGFAFARDDGYHFYFLLSGEARFKPNKGEFESGLLANLAKTRIILRKVPLAGDSRALSRCIEFQVPIDPPVTASLFDIFKFQLKGIGFHPASPKFDGAAAMSISGQIAFLPSGDIPNVSIDLHQLWIAPPRKGESLPRFRCDGLGVEVRAGSGTKVSATAIAVDSDTPSLVSGFEQPEGVTARGFLAKGSLAVTGWAPLRASMGFLELRKQVDGQAKGAPRHAMFVYGEAAELAQEICIFGYNIYLQEAGFGFGFRYTLAGIAEADKVQDPRGLVRVLDEVSKYQGNLHDFKAWRPEFDGSRMTLAMRVMFALTSASTGGKYDKDREDALPANPLLFDIVAALRSDLTLLMSGRLWLCRTYSDWRTSLDSEAWKERPMMRGYLYLSVPRQMMLARVLADGTGEVGDKPPMFGPLKKALESVRWSSTLYVAPGIFHQEFGWPYELGFTLENERKNFRLVVEAGLIIRIAEGSLLYGTAFRAKGFAVIGGRVGSSRLGASAEARADFAIEAKLIAYISTRQGSESFFYGLISLDVAVSFRVCVWLQIKIFKKRIRFEIGFSFGLSLSIALEAVIGAKSPFIGARARVSIGVRGFGRTLSVGVGVKFNDAYLTEARTRVARFMTLGLGVDSPDPEGGLGSSPAPLPEPSRAKQAAGSDQALLDAAVQRDSLGGYDADAEPADDPALPDDAPGPLEAYLVRGRDIGATNYWAVLQPVRMPPGTPEAEREYVLQLIPRDELSASMPGQPAGRNLATFFASPPKRLTEKDVVVPRAQFDHRLRARADLGTIRQFNFDQGTPRLLPIQWIKSGGDYEVDTHVNWGAPVPQPDASVNLVLAHLFGDCFLGPNVENAELAKRPFTEPSPRTFTNGRDLTRPNIESAGKDLHAAGRSRELLDGLLADSAIVEERRSALIGIVSESAARLSEQDGVREGGPARDTSNGVDCRDLGLTFLVSRTRLDALFRATTSDEQDNQFTRWEAKFSVQSAVNRYLDAATDEWGDTAPEEVSAEGNVFLLNHPSQFFAESQPTLVRQSSRMISSGLALDWDLEPAWGASASAVDDPEFVLKHYRIERRIIGGVGIPSRTLTVKPGAPMQFVSARDIEGKPDPTKYSIDLMRPNFQFVDDFADLQPALRAALLRLPGAVEDATGNAIQELASDAWAKAFVTLASVRVVYAIVAVDIAGTEADATIIEHTIQPPEISTKPLKLAQLAVAYEELPDATAPQGVRPSLALTVLDDRPERASRLLAALVGPPLNESGPVFVLRVRRSRVTNGGVFGDDHIPPNDRINVDADADQLQRDDLDFIVDLTVTPAVNERLDIRYQVIRGDGSIDYVAHPARVYLAQNLDEADLNLTNVPVNVPANQMSFHQALGLADSGTEIPSVRLFARPFVRGSKPEKRSGFWRTVDLTLKVLRPRNFTAKLRDAMIEVQVERLERPLRAAFRALDRSDIRVDSGGLRMIYPPVAGSLREFVNGVESSNLRTVKDPQRRSAIKLEWAAHPLVLSYSGNTAEPPRGLIGGFDLFTWNPAALPHAASEADSLRDDVPRHARHVGRVGVLPDSMRGLVPAEVGELSRVEALYPSATWRLLEPRANQGAARPKRRRWYSGSETVLVWPEKLARGQLLPMPEESDVSRCFAQGVPGKIIPSVTYEGKTYPLRWIGKEAETTGIPCASPQQLRQALRALRWTDAAPVEALFDDKPQARRELELNLAVETRRKTFDLKITLEFDGSYHAVLEELLAELRYSSNGPGMYRRYEPVIESAPKISSQEWMGFLEETTEASDPYGWGVLRYFGLAACLRLYDTEQGVFLSGKDLAKRVSAALDTVLRHYKERAAAGSLGAPFVELVAPADALCKLSPFDEGAPRLNADELSGSLYTFVQVSLRPAPQQLVGEDMTTSRRSERLAVQYLILTFTAQAIGECDKVALTGINPDEWKKIFNQEGDEDVEAVLLELNVVDVEPKEAAKTLAVNTDEAGLPLESVDDFVQVKKRPRKEGDVFAYCRLTIIGNVKALNQAELSALLRAKLLPACLDLKWNAHPAEQERSAAQNTAETLVYDEMSYERFAPLSKPLVTRLLAGSPKRSAVDNAVLPHQEWQSLYLRLARWGDGFKDTAPAWIDYPAAVDANEHERRCDKYESDWGEIVTRLGEWSRRFVEHTLAAPIDWTRPDIRIPFALATIPQPDPWRVAVRPDGKVSVLLLEKDRFGKQVCYALRPFGRYEPFEEAERRTAKAVQDILDEADNVVAQLPAVKPEGPSLDGALDTPPNHRNFVPFVKTTVDRTERVASPVVLSARRADAADGTPGRRLEIIVARGEDEILADANTVVESAVVSRGLGFEVMREYSAKEWTSRLSKTSLGVVQPLEKLQPYRVTGTHVKAAWDGVDGATARGRVPDLWRGAVAMSFADVPYFYRTHVLAYSAAGVVVSDQAVGTIAEGEYLLDWTRPQPHTMPPALATGPSPHLKWWVEDLQTQNAQGRGKTRRCLIVQIPLVRFVDCMTNQQIENWVHGNNVQQIPRVFYVPDPAAHYRLSIGVGRDANTPPVLSSYPAIASEIELRPVDEARADAATGTPEPDFYHAQAVGHRFEQPPIDDVIVGDPQGAAGGTELCLRAVLSGKNPEAPSPAPPYRWPKIWMETPTRFDALELSLKELGSISRQLPVRKMIVSVAPFAANNVAALQAQGAATAAALAALIHAIPDPADPADESVAGLGRMLPFFEALAAVNPGADPAIEWANFLAKPLQGELINGRYELAADLPAGNALKLPASPDLTLRFDASLWRMPAEPEARYAKREDLDAVLAAIDAQGQPRMDAVLRLEVRQRLREQLVWQRRKAYELGKDGFAPSARPTGVDNLPWDWGVLQADDFDVLHRLRMAVPADAAARVALVRAIDSIPTATSAAQEAGIYEDDPASTLSEIEIEVPERSLGSFAHLQSQLLGRRCVLRRPLTQATLNGITNTNVRALLQQLMADMLFGPERELLLQVFRATAKPLFAPVPIA